MARSRSEVAVPDPQAREKTGCIRSSYELDRPSNGNVLAARFGDRRRLRDAGASTSTALPRERGVQSSSQPSAQQQQDLNAENAETSEGWVGFFSADSASSAF